MTIPAVKPDATFHSRGLQTYPYRVVGLVHTSPVPISIKQINIIHIIAYQPVVDLLSSMRHEKNIVVRFAGV